MAKKILLIIAHKNFQPVEYYTTKSELERAGLEVSVASDKTGAALPSRPAEPAKVGIDVSGVRPEDYDGVFLIGGQGALDYLDNEKVYQLMRRVESAGKIWGGICCAPRILANAGLLKGKKATGWDGDNQLEEIFESAGAAYVKQPVIVDGKLVTADGPDASADFGRAIANLCL